MIPDDDVMRHLRYCSAQHSRRPPPHQKRLGWQPHKAMCRHAPACVCPDARWLSCLTFRTCCFRLRASDHSFSRNSARPRASALNILYIGTRPGLLCTSLASPLTLWKGTRQGTELLEVDPSFSRQRIELLDVDPSFRGSHRRVYVLVPSSRLWRTPDSGTDLHLHLRVRQGLFCPYIIQRGVTYKPMHTNTHCTRARACSHTKREGRRAQARNMPDASSVTVVGDTFAPPSPSSG